MRNTLLLALAASFVCAGYSPAQTTRKSAREEEKAAQEALDKFSFEEARKAIEGKKFVLEADQVVFKYGENAFVSSNTNFVGVDEEEATVQVAFNVPVGGPNGLGGVTVEGRVTDYEVKTDKKDNILISMNVMGTGISARVDITMPRDTNRATATITPNFNSNRFTLKGRLIPMDESKVFKGHSL